MPKESFRMGVVAKAKRVGTLDRRKAVPKLVGDPKDFLVIAGIAGYNLWKIVDAADSMDYIGIGLYMTIAGGIVTAVAGLLGPRINPS